MWRVWKNTFNNVVKKHAPLRTRRVRSSKSPWITPELKQHMHKRDILKVKAIRSKVPNDWAAFKTFRNYVTNEIKLVKETHYQNAFHQNKQNMKKTRGIVNELTSRKQSSPQVKEVKTNGSLISEPNELSEVFNDHFASIGSNLAQKIPYIGNGGTHLDYLPSQTNDNFRPNTTSPLVVGTLLSKLCKSKATGLDKISARLLCDCSNLIADSICAIFNCSINSSTFPNEWKCSKVIPLFKKGERWD
jgi:hypothetical protein